MTRQFSPKSYLIWSIRQNEVNWSLNKGDATQTVAGSAIWNNWQLQPFQWRMFLIIIKANLFEFLHRLHATVTKLNANIILASTFFIILELLVLHNSMVYKPKPVKAYTPWQIADNARTNKTAETIVAIAIKANNRSDAKYSAWNYTLFRILRFHYETIIIHSHRNVEIPT